MANYGKAFLMATATAVNTGLMLYQWGLAAADATPAGTAFHLAFFVGEVVLASACAAYTIAELAGDAQDYSRTTTKNMEREQVLVQRNRNADPSTVGVALRTTGTTEHQVKREKQRSRS